MDCTGAMYDLGGTMYDLGGTMYDLAGAIDDLGGAIDNFAGAEYDFSGAEYDFGGEVRNYCDAELRVVRERLPLGPPEDRREERSPPSRSIERVGIAHRDEPQDYSGGPLP